MTENPWTTLKSTNIYENPWIKLEQHEVLNPAGNPGIYGKIHFKNRAMAIIPIDPEGNTWLIGQYRYPLGEYSWEIPMGGGPIACELLESAQRELKEETGLIAGKWTQIMKIHTSNSVTDEVGYVYLAEELTQGETEFEETEVLQIKKLPFREVLEMVMAGEITDSLSIAGILKAARILGY
ncbi:NUDIX domain-containing protein [Algoriphagus boritolerans]|uniref:GDP-mannose pyrophosphatase n=1 Tax=Algoriphagus boritolerans DSM 17298 = JCM 18970 TaxID=1120964 RepID=A0A1H5VL66_9BACT|nr:NUDIX hydrolase [Algoriphagus boritolerans]SEF88019.1 8-oxo-dGTP pyrophosphatase MutT, NUDIX family [Algoriphagus boritolerans DSM 17298 = JCM 18970]